MGDARAGIDVENILSHQGPVRDALERFVPSKDRNIANLTRYLPRATVTGFWAEAYGAALRGVKRSSASIQLVTSKLVYYNSARDEFYSPIDVNAISKRKPRCLIVIIDDIFDMFLRLSEKGELWEFEASRESYYEKLELDRNELASHARDQYLLDLLHKLRYLKKCQVWRQMALAEAENIAHELGIPFIVWGSKQLVQPLVHWIHRPSRTPCVYLSHPITSIRDEYERQAGWLPFVEEFNHLQGLFARHSILAVMPSAIDELRFKVLPPASGSKLRLFSPALSQRWKVPSGQRIDQRPDNAIQHTTVLASPDLGGLVPPELSVP